MIENFDNWLNESTSDDISGKTIPYIADGLKLMLYFYPTLLTYKEVEDTCKEKGDGWRLPTRTEMQSIAQNLDLGLDRGENTYPKNKFAKSKWGMNEYDYWATPDDDTGSSSPFTVDRKGHAFLIDAQNGIVKANGVVMVKELSHKELHNMRGTIQGKKFGL